MAALALVQRGSWPGWANADIYLAADAGAAYLSAKAAYERETGRADAQIAEPVGGLRTPAIDAAMLAAFRSRDPAQMRYWNIDPASKAPPGLNSPHNNGLCVDVWAGPASSWSNGSNWWIVNGPRFGLRRTLVGQGDLHHFQYFPGTATAALDVRALDGGAIPGEDDMAKPEFYPQGLVFWPNGYFTYYDQGVYNALHYFFVDNPGVELAGTQGTVTREVWAANDFMGKRNAAFVAAPSAEPPSTDVDELAAALASKLKLPTKVTLEGTLE